MIAGRERINGQHRVGVAVADDGQIRGEHERFDAPAMDDDTAGGVDLLRHFHDVVSERRADARQGFSFHDGSTPSEGDHMETFGRTVGISCRKLWRKGKQTENKRSQSAETTGSAGDMAV